MCVFEALDPVCFFLLGWEANGRASRHEGGRDTACDAFIRICCRIQHAAAPPRVASCGTRGVRCKCDLQYLVFWCGSLRLDEELASTAGVSICQIRTSSIDVCIIYSCVCQRATCFAFILPRHARFFLLANV